MNNENNRVHKMQDTKTIRREEILSNVIKSAKLCQTQYGGRKELATEKDDVIVGLLDGLEDALNYGLRMQATSLPIAILQNVHEIVSGNSTPHDYIFWDFCQKHLTNHERERFNNLKHVWTKYGKVKAFIRVALNENSLRRYVLTWLDDPCLYDMYEPWAFMVDPEAANLLPSIASGLNTILFALNVDTPDINVNLSRQIVQKIEPIIYAPSPVGSFKKTAAIERPIESVAPEDVVAQFLPNGVAKKVHKGTEEIVIPIAPPEDEELESVEYEPECLTEILNEMLTKKFDHEISTHEPEQEVEGDTETEADVRSETSSQYSKSSSAVSSANAYRQQSMQELEDKLCEMTERCALLETCVAQLSLENRQLRRLTNNTMTETTANFLITIPQVKLIKTGHRSYYSYEVHLTMRDKLEHWMIMRRYREFYMLHKYLKALHPGISTIEFPPKKRFGNMNRVFVEERRQQLQIYLINVMEFLPQVEACRCKEDLQRIFPFFQGR